MTGGRLSLSEIRDRIAANSTVAATTGIKVGSALDADYFDAFTQSFPAIWVVGQRTTPLDPGDKYSSQFRQSTQCEVAVRVLVKRFIDGDFNRESELNALSNAASAALLGWQPTGSAKPFSWGASQDGEPSNTVMVVDLVFKTEVVYQQ